MFFGLSPPFYLFIRGRSSLFSAESFARALLCGTSPASPGSGSLSWESP